MLPWPMFQPLPRRRLLATTGRLQRPSSFPVQTTVSHCRSVSLPRETRRYRPEGTATRLIPLGGRESLATTSPRGRSMARRWLEILAVVQGE